MIKFAEAFTEAMRPVAPEIQALLLQLQQKRSPVKIPASLAALIAKQAEEDGDTSK